MGPHAMGREARIELLQVFRQICTKGMTHKKDLMTQVARMDGYQRVGTQIKRKLENYLLTAVKRGILERDGEYYSVLSTKLEGYDRDHLKKMFLASMNKAWLDREDAIREFTRYMGYSRTTEGMMETGRSLIHGLLLEKRLEKDGPDLIRKV